MYVTSHFFKILNKMMLMLVAFSFIGFHLEPHTLSGYRLMEKHSAASLWETTLGLLFQRGILKNLPLELLSGNLGDKTISYMN